MHYEHAPIAEAVIDVHVAFDATPSIDDLKRFSRQYESNFPQVQSINTLSVAVNDEAHSTSSSALGLRLTTKTGDRILQVRRQGMSFSHMEPYSRWESFVGEFRLWWDVYVSELKPQTATRFAVRYINRIKLQADANLDDYLTVSPRVPTGKCSANGVEGYFLQLVLPQRDLGDGCKAIVNTGLEPGVSPAVLLDIDVFLEGTSHEVKDERIWTILDQLRHRKNDVFEGSITDKVREMIK